MNDLLARDLLCKASDELSIGRNLLFAAYMAAGESTADVEEISALQTTLYEARDHLIRAGESLQKAREA